MFLLFLCSLSSNNPQEIFTAIIPNRNLCDSIPESLLEVNENNFVSPVWKFEFVGLSIISYSGLPGFLLVASLFSFSTL